MKNNFFQPTVKKLENNTSLGHLYKGAHILSDFEMKYLEQKPAACNISNKLANFEVNHQEMVYYKGYTTDLKFSDSLFSLNKITAKEIAIQ